MEQQLLARIEKLEAANRRLKLGGVLCLLLLTGLAVFVNLRKEPGGTVQANEFWLKGSHGETVAKLSTNAFGTCLEIIGRENATGAELCAGDGYGATLSLSNHHGESRALLSAGSKILEGGSDRFVPGLLIAEQDGKNLVSATVGKETKFVVGHGTHQDSFVVSAPETQPTLTLFDTKGKPHWAAP